MWNRKALLLQNLSPRESWKTARDRAERSLSPGASDRDEHLFGRYEALVNRLERLGIAKNRRVSKTAGH